MTIGNRIRFYRKERGFTQSELAEMIGVSVQAISKWETDAGMPDISQIVPLAIVLNISTDVLLGLNSEDEADEIVSLRNEIGHHKVYFTSDEAQRIYDLAVPYFEKHPTNPEVAFWCLESLSIILTSSNVDKEQNLKECERYINCILRHETNADVLFKSYYVIARCYKLLGEKKKAEEVIMRIPFTFGDRTYWEAEFAYSEGDYKLALKKCKESFAQKARFISRCIRMARMISESTGGNDDIAYQIELNNYMLNILNAFLSGGDYMPARMIYQKVSLLAMMVRQYVQLGKYDAANKLFEELKTTRNLYAEFLNCKTEHSSLMFPMVDMNDEKLITLADIDNIIEGCKTVLKIN